MVRLKLLSGFSIVESLIAISILLTVITAGISLLSTQNYHARAKVDYVKLKQLQLFNSDSPLRDIEFENNNAQTKKVRFSSGTEVIVLTDHESNVELLKYSFPNED